MVTKNMKFWNEMFVCAIATERKGKIWPLEKVALENNNAVTLSVARARITPSNANKK